MIVVLKGKANGSNSASQVNLTLLKDPSELFRLYDYLLCLVRNRAKSGVTYILLSSLSKQRQVDFCELEADSFISKVKERNRGWRGGSTIKSTGYFFRGHGPNSQH